MRRTTDWLKTSVPYICMAVLVVGGCSGGPGSRGAVEVKTDGYYARVFYAPSSIRVFLFDENNKNINIENADARIVIRSDDKTILDRWLERAESMVSVPQDRVEAKLAATGGWLSAATPETQKSPNVEITHSFFWFPLEEGEVLPEGASAEIVIDDLEGRAEPLRLTTHVRYAEIAGYRCPKHFTRIVDEPGTCSRDGRELEAVRTIYRCPMYENVTSTDPQEQCWRCGMALEKTPLVSTDS